MHIVIRCHVILPCLLVIFSSQLGASRGGGDSQLDKVIEELRTKVAKSQVSNLTLLIITQSQL